MGKTVVAEEVVRDKIYQLFGGSKVRCGLLLGQLGVNKAYVLAIIPTPEEDDDAVSRSATSQSLSVQWAVDHARQVERMLPGGVHIVGAYLFSRPEVAQELQGQVRHLLTGVVGSQSQDGILSSWLSDKVSSSGLGNDGAEQKEAIFLQVCAVTHKITCRTINVHDRQSPLKPAELKFHSFTHSWMKVCCSLAVNEKFALSPQACADVRLQLRELRKGLLPFAQTVCTAEATYNNQLKQPDELIVSRTATGGRQAGKQQLTVDLWAKRTLAEESASKEVEGNECKSALVAAYSKFGVLRGQVDGCVFLHDKVAWQDVVREVKVDLLRSMSTRLSLLWEDLQQVDTTQEASSAQDTRVKDQYYVLPQRFFVPLDKLDICACDYMFQDEDVGQCIQRVKEILDIEPDSEKCKSTEIMPSLETNLSLLVPATEPVVVQPVDIEQEAVEEGRTPVVWAIMGAAMAAIVAAISPFLFGED